MQPHIHDLRLEEFGKWGFELTNMKVFQEENREMLMHPFRSNVYHIIMPFTYVENHLLDFNKISIRPYSLIFSSKNRVHLFDQTAVYDGIGIAFTEDFFCKNDDDLSMLQQNPLFNSAIVQEISPVNIREYITIVESIQTELFHPMDEFSAVIVRNLVHNFIMLSNREFNVHNNVNMVKGPDSQISQRYSLLISRNYKVIKSVAAYAQQLNITEKRLNIATSNVLGKTAKMVIDDHVGIEARRMIAFTSLSIKEIGFELGFSQTTHFIKYFTKHAGVSPATFRQQHS